MPRGKYVNHKGRSRHFTSPDELERERKKEQEKKWRKKKDVDDEDESSEEEEEETEEGGAAGGEKKSGSSEESESESDDENKKKKGVEGLIEIENPNRIVRKTKKPAVKVVADDEGGDKDGPTPGGSSSSVKPELSRREREELEKQRARAHYQKLHAEGKTEEARADLARLALVRKQREEAAKKREEEKKAKETASAAKHDQVHKALGKKS